MEHTVTPRHYGFLNNGYVSAADQTPGFGNPHDDGVSEMDEMHRGRALPELSAGAR